MRISALDLNNIKKAAMYRPNILERSINHAEAPVNSREEYPFGENVKMIHHITRRPKYFTSEEKDELILKYEKGTTMADLAKIYGCHNTTIGRILRKRNVEIRK